MEIDDIQAMWAQMNARLSSIENQVNNEKINKMKTAQEKLAAQYRTFAIIGMTMALTSWLALSRLFDLWIALAFSTYFLMAMAMDWILYRQVRSIDMAEMTLAEVADAARKGRRLHHICQIILIPIAVVLIGYVCSRELDNEYFLWGCAVGAIIGLALGLRAYFQMMDNYKTMIQ